jgi:hypothetical protein
MSEIGKVLVIAGLIMVGVGILLWSGLGRDGLGRLPGDLHFTNAKGSFSVYLPVATCLLLSALLTLVLWFFRK